MYKALIIPFLFIIQSVLGQSIDNYFVGINSLDLKSDMNKNGLEQLSFTLYYNLTNTVQQQKLLTQAIDYIGTPYKYGGTSKKGIDCSAFTQTIYYLGLDITLTRTASSQYEEGVSVPRDSLVFGDLVFFHTRRKYVSHVGMYLGGNKFIHSSCKSGVTVSDLNDDYYSKRLIGAKRVLN